MELIQKLDLRKTEKEVMDLIALPGARLKPEVKEKFLLMKSLCPEAVLAGGAVRDSYFDVPVKDVDVYVGPKFTADFVKEINETIPFELEHDSSLFDEYQNFNKHVMAIYTSRSPSKPNEIPIQIIVCDKLPRLESLLHQFDWGFCQIGTTDGEHIFMTSTFKEDVANNTATLTFPADHPSKNHSLKRAVRLIKKYQERQFMVPLTTEQMNLLAYDYDQLLSGDGNLNFALA